MKTQKQKAQRSSNRLAVSPIATFNRPVATGRLLSDGMNCGIYGLRNRVNNKWYIGASKNIHNRIRGHHSGLTGRYHDNKLLETDWLKYGKNNFEEVVIEITPEENLERRERFWILNLKTLDRKYGYNVMLATKRSKRQKVLISNYHGQDQ